MPPSMTLITIVSVIFAIGSAASSPATAIAAAQSGESSQLPAGISDLLAATPTMLSTASKSMSQDQAKLKPKTLRTGNTVTVTGSDIVFAGSDKPTLVDTVLSMIRNSEPSTTGDDLLTRSIMTALSTEGSEYENVVKKQIETALECRDHEAMLRKCVETLVDIATFGDKKETSTGDEHEDKADKQITDGGNA